MKDHHLKAWLRLVETGSIRAAARSLHLSQAAITKAVKELEEDLDAPLVVRSSRGVTLTECGHQLTSRARMAQAQLALARQDIRELQGGNSARVAVAVTPMAFLSVLPEVMRSFRLSMPLADVTIDEGLMPMVLPALREGAVDFAVAAPVRESIGSDFSFEPLLDLDTMLACRRGHPLENATQWSELLECEWLMYLSPGSQHTHFLENIREAGLARPRRIIKVNTFGVGWNLLTRSDALLTCPAGMLKTAPYGDQVSRIPLAMSLPPITLGILTLRDNPLSLAATRFAELFRRAIRSDARLA
ncbi:LysR family transcriptional regulator [Cupriavidus basilensis OR16]|uniref:LysR family transcriptional regulator n=1 Tax=Cupriavidus basilensis OR16 TaxID=1127483 RepID=H1SBB0_9BURK|nr:LysR substrate-binding domain-containing protein [Cupriavidus basilensis]EHP40181.1 LysR family transcriptional regulator [Cupriavidus basilensis OR16]